MYKRCFKKVLSSDMNKFDNGCRKVHQENELQKKGGIFLILQILVSTFYLVESVLSQI